MVCGTLSLKILVKNYLSMFNSIKILTFIQILKKNWAFQPPLWYRIKLVKTVLLSLSLNKYKIFIYIKDFFLE